MKNEIQFKELGTGERAWVEITEDVFTDIIKIKDTVYNAVTLDSEGEMIIIPDTARTIRETYYYEIGRFEESITKADFGELLYDTENKLIGARVHDNERNYFACLMSGDVFFEDKYMDVRKVYY